MTNVCPDLSVTRPPHRPIVSRIAFTLVELLVVIAIIGILVALLLPAVQSARESARNSQCRNNLKQMSLGAILHEEAAGAYPTAGWGYKWIGDVDRGLGKGQPGGWRFSVLPFIEQEDLFQLGQGESGEARRAAFRALLTTPVPTFYCPSRRPVALYEQRSRDGSSGQWVYNHPDDPGYVSDVVKCDYVGNAGTHNISGTWNPGPNNYDGFDRYSFPDSEMCTGLFWWAAEFKHRMITDGTSKTLLLGEQVLDITQLDNWRAGDPQNAYIGMDPEIARFAGRGYPLLSDTLVSATDLSLTQSVFGGSHPGGVNFAMADGSVQRVEWDIDFDALSRLAHRSDGGGDIYPKPPGSRR